MFAPAQSRFGLDRHRVPRDLRLASIVCALAIAAGVAGAFSFNTIFIPTAGRPSFVWLTTFFFRVQDAPWLLWIALMLLGFGILRLPPTPRGALRVAIAILTALVFVCGIIGTHVIFHGFPLARDEILAEFDALFYGRAWRSRRSPRNGGHLLPLSRQRSWFLSLVARVTFQPISPLTLAFAR